MLLNSLQVDVWESTQAISFREQSISLNTYTLNLLIIASTPSSLI